MKHLTLLVIGICSLIFSCATNKKLNQQPVQIYSEQVITDSTKMTSPSFVCGLEEVMWKDSSLVTFFTIQFIPKMQTFISINKKFTNYSGPITVGSSFLDECLIYSISTNNETGYFLLDDFLNEKDSLLYVQINGATGYIDMNDETPIYANGNIPRSELMPNIDSLKKLPNKIYATKEWYVQWLKEHPRYIDQRTNEYNGKNCD